MQLRWWPVNGILCGKALLTLWRMFPSQAQMRDVVHFASTADYTASEVLRHLVGQTEGGSSASTNQRAGSMPKGQSSKRFGELRRVSDELLAAGGVDAEAEEETIQEALHELNASNEDLGAVEHKDWYDNYADGHWRWDHETPHG